MGSSVAQSASALRGAPSGSEPSAREPSTDHRNCVGCGKASTLGNMVGWTLDQDTRQRWCPNCQRPPNPSLHGADTEAEPARAWRCFQCDEVFTDPRAAAEHFTGDTSYPPACVRQLQNGERWAHAEIARLEAHARHMYRLKTALECALQDASGSEAVEAVYRSVSAVSPLVALPEAPR